MTSPTWRPAAVAGDPGVTAVIWAPPEGAFWMLTPRKPWLLLGTVPFFRLSTSGVIRSIAMANPTFWPSLDTAVFMPITWPPASTSGPPEFPGLIGASVWMRLVSRWLLALSERLRPEMIPDVTVGPPGERP